MAQRQRWPQHPVWQAVYKHSSEPFREERWSWAAVLMLQRLLTVMCQSLSRQAAVRSMSITMVSLVFAMLQVHAKPFHSERTNRLQLVALVCLTLVSLLNGTRAVLDTVGIDATKTQAGPLASFVKTADWLMLAMLLLPLLMALVDGLVSLWRSGGCSSSATTDADADDDAVTDAETAAGRLDGGILLSSGGAAGVGAVLQR